MAMSWYETSQINLGLILKGIKSPQAYLASDFFPKFDEIVEYMQQNEDWCRETLYPKFAPSELDGALHSVASLNGSSTDVDWPTVLRTTAKKWELGSEFEKIGKSLKKGDTPEVIHIRSGLDSLTENQTLGAERASEIDLDEVADLQPSGWKEIDETFGGMPVTGPLILYGTMGTGKSFCTSKYADKFLHYYPDRKVGAYSLEMSSKRYLKRAMEMYPSLTEVMDRLWISGKARGIEDIIAEASVKNFDMVIIDSIDYLPDKEISAAVMDRLWKAIVRMGRILEIPIIVTAQPNRESKFNAKTRFLTKYDIAWSGSSEDAAEQLIALQYVQYAKDFEDGTFTAFDDSYYMISYKQRGGWPAQKGPGAIIFHKDDAQYTKDKDRILWEGKVFQNMLWREGANMRVGGNPKKSSRKKAED